MGTAEHAFTVGPLADAFAQSPTTSASATVAAGASATVTYTFTGIGPFAFASHAGGDLAAGQVGYVMVVGPDVPRVGTAESPRLVPLKVAEDGFNRRSLAVKAGETITFVISNVGTAAHELVVGPADKVTANQVDQVTVVTTGPIAGGHVVTLTYTFPEGGGAFGFASHQPGDDAAGAAGSITVR